MAQINTPLGKLHYKFQPLYNGRKRIDKVIAKDNLLLFNSIAIKYGLSYILGWGTLLGAIREHDFIAHDEDTDLILSEAYFPTLLTMLWELQRYGFQICRYEQDLVSIMRKNEYIDLYIYAPYKPGILMCHNTLFLPESMLKELIDYSFLGQKFKIPKDYLGYLVLEYGQNWQTPIVWAPQELSSLAILYYKLKLRLKHILPYAIINIVLSRRKKKAFQAFINKCNSTAVLKRYK